MHEAEAAIGQLDQIHGRPTKRAELLLTAARCALAAGEPPNARWPGPPRRAALRSAGPALVAGACRAGAGELRASDAGPATAALLRDAQRCVRELSELSSPDQSLAQLATGRIALALGRTTVAHEHLAAAAAGRRHGPPLSRAVAWLAEALRAEAVGDSQRLMYACRRGLDVIDEYRSMLGSSELRAQTTAHGAELANLGQRHALRLGRPRMLLAWSERWRAVALAVPPVRPPVDAELQAELAAMRDISSRLSQAGSIGARTAALHHEQQRLERSNNGWNNAVRARALRTVGAGRRDTSRAGPHRIRRFHLLDELGDDRLLDLVDIDGQLHVLVCGNGKVRRFTAGTTAQAAREVEFARFMLSRLAYGPVVRPRRRRPTTG